jgi:hypothetical protein
MPLRKVTRRSARSVLRHTIRYTTRMLAGVRRPRPPDYLALYCRLLKRILKIDQSLRPFMQEQVQLYEKRRFEEEVLAALQRVYGSNPADPKPGSAP